MAKCIRCKSRKGKRKCIVRDGLICTLCCGETRSAEMCDGCSFFKDMDALRNYKKVPYHSLGRMANSAFLENQTQVVEGALCRLDHKQDYGLNDNIIAAILEQLLNHYHFGDPELKFASQLEKNGVKMIGRSIEKELSSLSPAEVSKIIATVYRSVKRHKAGPRAYLNFIHSFF